MAFIHIAGNTYELIMENRNGWNVEAFRTRYSDVLDRYDYIVGDWGYNQLRLKGFFKDGHQKATKDSTFSYVTDYINEYCNFGCAYFLLEKKHGHQAELSSEDDIYIEEAAYTRPVPQPKADNNSNDQKHTKEAKGNKHGNNKDSKDLKDAKTKSHGVPVNDSQGQSLNVQGKEGMPPRPKKSVQRDKPNEHGIESELEKPRVRNQRTRNHQRPPAKGQIEQLVGNSEQEQDQERKKEGKAKRKDNFYRKGNRYQDKKNKASKNQTEQIGSNNH